jgi:hypothetical protein
MHARDSASHLEDHIARPARALQPGNAFRGIEEFANDQIITISHNILLSFAQHLAPEGALPSRFSAG